MHKQTFHSIFFTATKPLTEKEIILLAASIKALNDPSFKRGHKEYEKIRSAFNRIKKLNNCELEKIFGKWMYKNKFKPKITKEATIEWIKQY